MGKWIFSRSLILAALAVAFMFAHAMPSREGFAPQRRRLCQGFAPENDEYIPDTLGVSAKTHTGITRQQFNEVLDRITAEYKGDVERLGGTFRIERKWSDGTVNAYAYRDESNHWILSMFGGMARYPGMNYDGFMTVACHETGHHFGGVPKFTGDDWAAVEGEADYYATLKCLRRVFSRDDNGKILAGRNIDATVKTNCEREHRSQQDRLLCTRVAQAGLDMGVVLAKLGKDPMPNVAVPSPRKVKRTFEGHPVAQCRVDTFMNGSLCIANMLAPMSDKDPYVSACRMEQVGARPLCWFKP